MDRDVRTTNACCLSAGTIKRGGERPVYLANTPNRKSYSFGRSKGIKKQAAGEKERRTTNEWETKERGRTSRKERTGETVRLWKGARERERERERNGEKGSITATEIDRPLRALSREVIKSARNLWPRSSFTSTLFHRFSPIFSLLISIDGDTDGKRETLYNIYPPASYTQGVPFEASQSSSKLFRCFKRNVHSQI